MPAPRNWYAVDVGLDTHPRIVEAGPWGSVAFQTAIRLIKRHGVGGRVEDRYVTGAYMARLLGFARDAAEVERLSEGIEAAVAAGLLARAGGFVEAPGWKDWQTDPGKGGRDATRRYATRYGRDTGATLARDERDTGAILLRDEREHVDTDTDTETRVKDSSPPTAPTAPTTSKNEVAHPKPKPKPPPNPDIRTIADAFFAEWAKHDAVVKPRWQAAEGAQAGALLKRAPFAEVARRIPLYWTHPSSNYGTRRGFLDFVSRFDRLGEDPASPGHTGEPAVYVPPAVGLDYSRRDIPKPGVPRAIPRPRGYVPPPRAAAAAPPATPPPVPRETPLPAAPAPAPVAPAGAQEPPGTGLQRGETLTAHPPGKQT